MEEGNGVCGTTTVDVVVVGGGGSGLAAASGAAEAGASVVLLEKNPRLGGSTALSVGSISATGTPHQRRAGIADNTGHHYEDMLKFSGKLVHRDNLRLARMIAEGAPDMFRWLLSTGLEFVGPFPEPPHRVPRMHNVLPNSRAFPYMLGSHCRRLGVDIRCNARVVNLSRDGGRVSGVVAEMGNGARHAFVARGGVILAAGDISGSRDLKLRYASELAANVAAVNPTNTGDGIRLGLESGGVMVNGELMRGPAMRFIPPTKSTWLQRLPPVRPVTRFMRWAFENLPEAILRPFLLSFLTTTLAPSVSMFGQGAILVDRNGVRFVDEREPRDTLDVASGTRPDGYVYVVFDSRLAATLNTWPNFVSSAPSVGYAYLDDYRRTRPDIYHRSDTVAGLAKSMGITEDALEQAISEYNAGSAPDGVAARGERQPLDAPPYFALGPAVGNIIYTDGGLDVNERMELVDADGSPIPGLYAAGANGQAGLLLKGHGHHLAWCFISGRLAGRNAALSATEHAG